MGWHMQEMGFSGYFNIMLLLIAFVVIGYFVVIHTLKQSNHSSTNALQILRRRYAKGEITKEEFIEMKNELTEERR
jgi:putative membrane protein